MSVPSPGSAGRVETYRRPPTGFDPRKASPAQLRDFGLPARPDASERPELAALWDEVFSQKLTYIVPTFEPVEALLPGVTPRGPLPGELTTVTLPFWSGCVVHAPAGQAFTWVVGQWNVPDVQPPATGAGNWYSFAWIGIDGTSDVTQIGTIQYVSSDGNGTVTKKCYAVREWWPNTWQVIDNFPVNFGDNVIGLICLVSPSEAQANLINVTTAAQVSFPIQAPSNILSQENQVEWIMERPGVTGESPPIPKFGDIYFDSAQGGRGLDFVANAGTDTVINMVENNETVATTTVETPTLVKVAYTGD